MTFLPGCKKCGRCDCECGKLPYTVTVSLSGGVGYGESPCEALVEACFGSGAVVVATAPSGTLDDAGPLTKVSVQDGGSCYAKLGRVEPTLTPVAFVSITGLAANTGNEATFSLVSEKAQDECGVDYWKVASFSVTGGSGYTSGDRVLAVVSGGGVMESQGAAFLTLKRDEPALSIVAPCGQGAEFSLTITKNDGTPETWGIDKVSVLSSGSGYEDMCALQVELGQHDVKVTDAVLEASIVSGGIASVSVTSGGKYYKSGVPSGVESLVSGVYYKESKDAKVYVADIDVSLTGCRTSGGGFKVVVAGDGFGADINPTFASPFSDPQPEGQEKIIGVDGFLGGYNYPDGAAVTISAPHDYDTITAFSATANVGGNPNGGPISSITGITAGVYKLNPKTAEFSATVDTNPYSPTFGQITDVTVTKGGQGYVAFETTPDCTASETKLSGREIVLKADDPTPLVHVSLESCFGSGACVEVNAVGDRLQPTFVFKSGSSTCSTTITKLYEDAEEQLPYWTVSKECLSAVTKVTGCGATQNGDKFYRQLEHDGSDGPIKLLKITKSGSGYASIGRVEPTVTIAATAGLLQVGGTFSPTLESAKDDCGRDYWYVKSVEASGGECYGVINVIGSNRVEPVGVTASVAGGSGAELSVTLAKATDDCKASYWQVSGVSVICRGEGYADKAPVVFQAASGDTVAVDAAGSVAVTDGAIQSVSVTSGGVYYRGDGGYADLRSAVAKGDTLSSAAWIWGRTRSEPELTATVAGGAGATFAITFDKQSQNVVGAVNSSSFDVYHWEVASVAVTSGGSGYTPGESPVTFSQATHTKRRQLAQATATVLPDGSVGSVSVSSGGHYYKDDGSIVDVVVSDGGAFYREDKSKSPYVANVTATVEQLSPSAGSDAEVSVTVNSTYGSTAFGSIVSAVVDKGGSDYTLLGGPKNCTYSSADADCDATLTHSGSQKKVEATLLNHRFRATEPVANCSEFSLSASALPGTGQSGSLSVKHGGVWNPCEVTSCPPCPPGPPPPDECEGYPDAVTISVSGINSCVDGFAFRAEGECGVYYGKFCGGPLVGGIELAATVSGDRTFASFNDYLAASDAGTKLYFSAESQQTADITITVSEAGPTTEFSPKCAESVTASMKVGGVEYDLLGTLCSESDCGLTISASFEADPAPGPIGPYQANLIATFSKSVGSCGWSLAADAVSWDATAEVDILTTWSATFEGEEIPDEIEWELVSCVVVFPNNVDITPPVSEATQAIIDGLIANSTWLGEPECPDSIEATWTNE